MISAKKELPNNKIFIFDTTLRDGEQSAGVCMTPDEKIKIAHQLKALNVDVIEAGFPVISEGEFHAVKTIAEEVKNVTICAMARAVERDVHIAGEALNRASKRRINVFIATSALHLEYKLKKTREQVLKKAIGAVKLAKTYTNDVAFTAEDATRTDKQYLAQIVEAVIIAGATTITLPDTVGCSTPEEYAQLIEYIKENVKNINETVLSVHCHNDLGLATANSLAGIQAGARQIECTVNGIGERAGNCALEEVVMAINTRNDIYKYHTMIHTEMLTRTSRMVAALTGMPVQPNKAIVGKNAFAHGAGIHQHGVLVKSETYEIMKPASVGYEDSSFVIGKHSGHHAIKEWLNRNDVDKNHAEIEELLKQIKTLSDKQKGVDDEDIFRLLQITRN